MMGEEVMSKLPAGRPVTEVPEKRREGPRLLGV